MGEKKDLREENAALRQRIEELEADGCYPRDYDPERDPPRGQPSGRHVSLERVGPNAGTPGVLSRVAAELGVTGDSDVDILSAINRLKNPDSDLGDGPQVTKGDTLLQAIEHNARERKNLLEGVTAARAIVGRVAGALNVGQWDADGSEIIEKAQRLGSFAYSLKRRGEQYVKQGLGDLAGVVRVILVEFVAPKDLSKFVSQLPMVPESVLETAEEPPPSTPAADEFSRADIREIQSALKDRTSTRHSSAEHVLNTFAEMAASTKAGDEFCAMMNLIIIPHLRRLRRA